MEINPLVIFAFLLFDGVVIAWAAHEFWSVRKPKRASAEDPKSPAPDEAGHTEG